jgi:allophanate hydrolase subunit 2
MDQAAFKTANRLVGNASQLPVLETVGGGLSLQSVGENVVAVTGADAPLSITTADGRRWSAPRYAAIALADGDTLSLAQPVAGARCYVAVRGGYEVAPVLGSASTDTLAHVGPPALHSGQLLAVLPARHAVVAELALPRRTCRPRTARWCWMWSWARAPTGSRPRPWPCWPPSAGRSRPSPIAWACALPASRR